MNDEQRATKMVKGFVAKRLTYRTTGRKVGAADLSAAKGGAG